MFRVVVLLLQGYLWWQAIGELQLFSGLYYILLSFSVPLSLSTWHGVDFFGFLVHMLHSCGWEFQTLNIFPESKTAPTAVPNSLPPATLGEQIPIPERSTVRVERGQSGEGPDVPVVGEDPLVDRRWGECVPTVLSPRLRSQHTLGQSSQQAVGSWRSVKPEP